MAATTLLTMEQFLNLPDLEAGKRELIEGELIELPPATRPHNRIANRVVFALKNYLVSQARPHDQACMESGFEIPARRRSWLQPDAALLHPEQSMNASSYCEGAPLIAIEVISPSNRAREVERKRLIYLGNGAEEVWIVYPETKTVTTERAGGGGLLRHEDAIVSVLLPGFRLDFDELFERP